MDESKTVNFYYNIEVKGYFGDNWKPVETKYSKYEGPEPNAQLDSPYTVISVGADYPEDAVLDFRVQARIGYYYPYGPGIEVIGYDFYGQESDWSETVTFTCDFIPPQISILSPQQQDYFASDVSLVFSVNEQLNQTVYSLDGEENTVILGNTTLTGLSDGSHNITVYAWDVVGNAGVSETVFFEVKAAVLTEIVVIATVVSIVLVGIGLLIYFRKRRG